MASSSCSRTWQYDVFASFHGPDVRTGFLGHLRNHFNFKGITMFDDQKMMRSHTIGSSLTEGIRESRISIVILSKNYAASSWCLDELLDILKCKDEIGQIVMPIFYGADPSDVRNQTGYFGSVFNGTCARRTEEKRQDWSKALNDVGNIAGEHLLNWKNEADEMEKIAIDVLDKLIATPSKDFDGMVGLEAHLRELESLLELDNLEVKMVGISGPAGIGKTTIARAFHIRHPNRFQLTCFMDNLRGSYDRGLDDLKLQTQFLSKVLNQDGIRICHSGAIKDRLCRLRVLIILDDVDNIRQLQALANETTWFGPGSRIIVTTEDQKLLQQHGINNTYHVKFPSDNQALEILCRYAFRQSYPLSGFKELALRVTELCGNLPLGLRVVGSSLRGNIDKDEWEEKVRRLETILDHQDIEKVLRVGYESLHENEQSLFLHIAVFFNYKDGNFVKAMLADKKLDVKHGLKILANKSLIYLTVSGEIVMHKLLQQVGTIAAREKPWKRRILTDPLDVCDILQRAKGTGQVSGILLDTSGINEVYISKEAFKNMPNLRFLKVINGKDGNEMVHIPKDIDFPRNLRLLHWEAYPEKSFPMVNMKFLVELNMKGSKLEYLWQGRQPLANLKKIYLSGSLSLKALPDLSDATNLEGLDLDDCQSLEEIPFTFGNLQKLEWLVMYGCINLQVVPTHFNLASLEMVNMMECSKLRKYPDFSTNTTRLSITDTMLEELPNSIERWSRLENLSIYGSLEVFADIEKLPDWIKSLDALEELYITGCPKLASLPEFPDSLKILVVADCESLETLIAFSSESQIIKVYFFNCFKLCREARREIAELPILACLPGRTVPAHFDHQALGNSLTIRSDHKEFRVCAVVSPKLTMEEECELSCCIHLNGCLIVSGIVHNVYIIKAKHLFISYCNILEDGCLEQDNEISFEFITSSEDIDVIECGVRILTWETEESEGSCGSYEPSIEEMSEDDNENLYDDEFCAEPVYEDDGETLFHGSNESDEPSVKRLKTG